MIWAFQIVTYICIGFFAGFVSGMFGVGGGSIRIPLLNFAGLSLLNAFGTNLLVIPFSSSIGAFSQIKNIKYKVGLYMMVGGILGSLTGAFLVGLIPTLILAITFVIVSVLTVFGIYLDRIAPRITKRINPSPWSISLSTLLLSLIIGIRGGSGGALFPPFLKIMKFDMHKAIATSLFVTIFTSATALTIYWYRGDIAWAPALLVVTGSVIGSRMGSTRSLKTKSTWLEIGLSVFTLSIALLVIYKAL